MKLSLKLKVYKVYKVSVLQFLYMLPILVSVGSFKLYTYGLVLAVGLFFGLYWWWKMGRDEHWDEIALFDSYFLSLIIFLAAGRAGYVALHFAELGTLYRSLALLAFPGIDVVVGVVSLFLFLIFFARARGWDAWKAMDAGVVTLSFLLLFGGLAGLLNGSHPGKAVSWGLMYPGQTVARVPVDIWILVWALITFGVVSSVRKNFRFYSWYKAEASVVREGLATLVFGVAVGFYYMVAAWLRDPSWKIFFFPGSFVVGLLLLAFSLFSIYRRAGKKTSNWRAGLHESWLRLLQWVRRHR